MRSTKHWCILELPCLIDSFFLRGLCCLLMDRREHVGKLREEGQNYIEGLNCVLKEAFAPNCLVTMIHITHNRGLLS